MFSYDFSVISSLIRNFGVDFPNTNWFVNPVVGFGIIGLVVIWGAIPFITISLYAALTQIPKDFVEAAELDGASKFQVFRMIYLPLLMPVYIILISLSVIWDFQVFAHIWVMLEFRPDPQYYTMAVYAFQTSFGISEYGRGSAIAVVIVFILLLATVYYLRKMIQEAK
jgi:N,N'-diacetylchitobiose transport system permease protein